MGAMVASITGGQVIRCGGCGSKGACCMGAVMASITGGRVMGKSDKGAAGVAARARAAWVP